jgi:hypothetical protein
MDEADPERYFHLIDKNGHPADSPSPFCAASQELDIRAFTAFMRHLKAFDPQRTVIIVQVENEPGTWGSGPRLLAGRAKALRRPRAAGRAQGHGQAGRRIVELAGSLWPEAEETFTPGPWPLTSGKVAAAGKAVYPLPLYANAALRDPAQAGRSRQLRSGGPTDNVIPIWKVAAPAIDIVSPDIYMNDPAAYLKVLELYHRDDNAAVRPGDHRQRRACPVLLFRTGPAGDRLLALRSGL